MRKRSRRKPRSAYVPLILAYDQVALRNHTAGAALLAGTCSLDQWDLLASAYNLLAVGAASAGRADLTGLCDAFVAILVAQRPVIASGVASGLTEVDRGTVRQFLLASDDFWRTHGAGFYNDAVRHIQSRLTSSSTPPGELLPVLDSQRPDRS